ncbi:S-layer homology domain-containing protein [Aedoeadaptatus pacaensis]|uniref:S-layer homology domain-containing protein n=1 Tax=Aedoeadaptatus pacaensis TaxID=1776390 RepID=UPI0008382437|nr:S-layer homology domain-containing protein [Peptoniphilus pacaensis]
MNKKFLSLVLALVMVLGTFGNVFAAEAKDKKEVKEVPKLTTTEAKAQWLIDNGYVVGTADKDGKATGNMDLKSPIRRDAVAKMLVFAIGEKDLAAKLQGVYTPFPDVKVDNIMNGFITAAASKTANGVPIIVGYQDGTFRPTKDVTYAELAKMLVVAIDKDLTPAKAASYSWPQGWMERAAQLDIFSGLSIADANKPAVRSDAFAMIFNAFYKLKNLEPVPANEFRGVISESSDGTTLVLNQGEFKKEFKVTKDTIFVNQKGEAKKWIFNKVAASDYYVGSVVRVLFNKDGVVSHIIEMGNPVDGIKNHDRAWVELGNKSLQLASNWQKAKPVYNVTLNKDNIEFINTFKNAANKAVSKFEVNSETEFYVADAGVYTKVKDYDAAKKLVADKDNKTYNVYLAYEKLTVSGVNEARIVVFNKAEISADTTLVRVNKAVSNKDFKLYVEKPAYEGGEVTAVSALNDQVWGYTAINLNKYDVAKLPIANNKLDFNVAQPKLIDAKKDNVYEVVDVLLNGASIDTEKTSADMGINKANKVVLKDKDNYVQAFDLEKDYKYFFGKEFKKGAKVQIAVRSDNKDIIQVVSVLPNETGLKGNLEKGVRAGLVKGKLVSYNKVDGHLAQVTILPEGSKDAKTYLTALEEKAFSKDGKSTLEAGAYVEAKVEKLLNTTIEGQITEVLQVSADVQSIKDGLDKFILGDNTLDMKDAKKTRAALISARDAFIKLDASLLEKNRELANEINRRIDEFNKLNVNGEANDIPNGIDTNDLSKLAPRV